MNKNSKDIRKNILRLANKSKNVGAHISPSLSIVEILSVLFCEVMNHDKDLFILSKGHAGLAYYCAMQQAGIISDMQLNTFEDNGGEYPGQPTRTNSNGILFASGSLGLGLSYAAGIAYSMKMNNSTGKVYVLVGNGELNEGSNYESLMFIKHHNLNNVVIIVDNNNMQSDGITKDILDINIKNIFSGFGFNVITCNGHDEIELKKIFLNLSSCCNVVVANTIKGFGVSFMQNNNDWHHAKLTDEKYNDAILEVNNE